MMDEVFAEFYKKINYPLSVRKEKNAQGAATLCGGSGELTLSAGSYVVYDMGAPSVGGYPTFRVSAFSGEPALHISYSDRFAPFEKEETMEKGDFTRGSCTYLGVELPVMPANPYRFEDYSVRRTGQFVYPLIQGQERFVCISVPEGSAGQVSLSEFAIVDDSAPVLPVGYFQSDREDLNRLWLASARTLRLASVQANQWEDVRGKLCLRKLTKWQNAALAREFDLGEMRLCCDFQISRNPEYPTGIGILFFAQTPREGALLEITEKGEVSLWQTGKDDRVLLAASRVAPLTDNVSYHLEIDAAASGAAVFLEGTEILRFDAPLQTGGSFGFWMDTEWRAVCEALSVFVKGEPVYEWQGGTEDFDIRRSGFFISDGAKRDRLPWSGDLDWAFDCGWYSFGERMDALNTLRILAVHQSPEGYIFGTCYPENTVPPNNGEYGDYQSDMFAAWYVVSALTYYELSADMRVKGLFGTLRRCMDYLWRYVDKEDGLFEQRFETSKGLWDHYLGDTGKNTYTNLMILDAFERLAPFAEFCGETAYAKTCRDRAKIMREGIFTHLYDSVQGGFVKRKDWRELCDMSNPYAMGKRMVSRAQAKQIAAQAEKITHAYGKIAVLMIRGLYDYGYPEKAEEMLCGKLPLYLDGHFYSNVDWMSVVNNPDLPETVYECMHNPPCDFGDNLNWGDLSHPDSGICGVLSSRIAGVMPLKAGFTEVLVKPHLGNCRFVRCRVPTLYGNLDLEISIDEGRTLVTVDAPEEIKIWTDFSELAQPVHTEIRCTGTVIKNKEVI